MAAKTTAEKGLAVALLERRKDPAIVIRPCSEILTLNEDIYGEYTIYNSKSHTLYFLKSGCATTYDSNYQNIESFLLYSMDGNCIRFLNSTVNKEHIPLPLQMVIKKETLLKGLLREAEKNSVHIFNDTNIISLEKKKETIKVFSSEGKTYEGAFVIAADGVNSRVAHHLGLNKQRTFYGTLRGLAWYIRGVKLPAPNLHIHIVGGQEVGIECSINPRATEDEYFISLCGLNPKMDLHAWSEHVMGKSCFSSWFKNSEKIRRSSFVANIYSPLVEPFKDNALLIGDAATTLQATNRGALICGWNAGNVVSRAFYTNTLNREGIQEYLRWWKESYGDCDYTVPFPLRGNTGAILSSDELCYLFSLFTEPFPFTSNPFTSARTMSKAVEKLQPLIKKERPEIIDKLTELRTGNLTELMDTSIKAGFPNR